MDALRHVRLSRVTILLLTLAVLAAGCGSSSHHATGTSPPATSAPAAGGAPAGVTSEVTANWTAFFSGQTPAAKKVTLLQNGPAFAQVIDAQASSPLAQSSSAKVTKVTTTGPAAATVEFSIYLGNTAALPNQTGTAVLDNGTWKVSQSTFCAILALEQNHPPACGA